MSRKALGRGLKALIPEQKADTEREYLELEIGRIVPGRFQPREDFDHDRLEELAKSIKARGIIQPVLVQPHPDGKRFELIAGERRWRAAHEAGLSTIPAVVRKSSDEEALELALIENIQREDLNPVEAARAYQRLIEKFDLTQEELSVQVGKDRSSIANHLRLLKLPQEIQDDLIVENLTMGHARALLSLGSRDKQMKARKLIIAKGLSVRDTETLVRKITGGGEKGKQGKKPDNNLFINALEDNLRRSLGTKVAIRPSGRGGSIQIQYYSTSELERLTEIISGETPT